MVLFKEFREYNGFTMTLLDYPHVWPKFVQIDKFPAERDN